jgi:hypothetical protein
MRNLQPDAAGGIGLDEVHEVPGNIARRDAQEQDPKDSRWDHPFEQAANGAPRAHIHTTHS